MQAHHQMVLGPRAGHVGQARRFELARESVAAAVPAGVASLPIFSVIARVVASNPARTWSPVGRDRPRPAAMTMGNSSPFAACTVSTCTASSSVSSVVTLLRSSLSTRSATQRRYSPSDPPVCSNHHRASSSTRRSRRHVVTCAPSLTMAASECDCPAICAMSSGTGTRWRASVQPRNVVRACSTAGWPAPGVRRVRVRVPPAAQLPVLEAARHR